VTEKRAAVRDLYDKIKMAIDDVQYKQEKIKRKDHEGDNVSETRGGGCCCRGRCVLTLLQHYLLSGGTALHSAHRALQQHSSALARPCPGQHNIIQCTQ
jgi:hypothetical protein